MKQALLFLSWIEKAIIFVAFVLMAGVLMIDVIGREIISFGIVGAARMSVFPVAIMAFVAIGLCTATDGHLRPRAFDKIIPARFDPIMGVVKELVTAAFCLAVAYAAFGLVLESIEYEEKTQLLGWDVWPFQVSFAFAFTIAALRHIIFAASPSLRPASAIDPVIGEIDDLSIESPTASEGKS